MHAYRRLTLSKKQLEHLYLTKKLSIREIANMLNVSSTSVHKKLIKYKIPRRKPNETKRKLFISKEDLFKLYWKRNMASPEIAKLFGVSDSAIRNLMKKYGIPRKDTRFRKGQTPWIKGKKLTKECREKLSNAHGKSRPPKHVLEKLYWERELSHAKIAEILGVSRSAVRKWLVYYKIPRRSISEALKVAFKDQDLRMKKAKHLIKVRQRCISKIINALHSRPNKLERKVIEIIRENNLPFKYVGNGEVIINGRNPDFISTNVSKKVIEIFGNYWHSPLINPQVDPMRTYDETLNFYKKHGYHCLILWEDEVKDNVAIERIKQFLSI